MVIQTTSHSKPWLTDVAPMAVSTAFLLVQSNANFDGYYHAALAALVLARGDWKFW